MGWNFQSEWQTKKSLRKELNNNKKETGFLSLKGSIFVCWREKVKETTLSLRRD